MELNICGDTEASGSLNSNSTGPVWVLETPEQTKALGRLLAQRLPSGSILLLSGLLGAGKTSLVQGLAEGFEIPELVTSPTFALAQHYPQGTPQLVHLDLYRLCHPASAEELFLQEEENAHAVGAFMAVEWPNGWDLTYQMLGDFTYAITDQVGLLSSLLPKNPSPEFVLVEDQCLLYQRTPRHHRP